MRKKIIETFELEKIMEEIRGNSSEHSYEKQR